MPTGWHCSWLSHEQEDIGNNGDIIGADVTGGFGDISLGVGFQTHDNARIACASVSATFGDIRGGLNCSSLSNDAGDDVTHIGVGATYTKGVSAVNVDFGQTDIGGMEASGFGVAARYDLGGGVKIQFGYGNSQNADDATDDTWSLGLAMGFLSTLQPSCRRRPANQQTLSKEQST